MSVSFKPLSSALGAEVIGLDLAQPIEPDTVAALRAAFLKHHLLLVRQPDVTAEQQARYAQVFGKVTIRGKSTVAEGEPDTQYVSNARADGILGNGDIDFHQDHVFYDEPLKAIILYGVEIPSSGSGTRFRNAIKLVDKLPDALRARAEQVRCLHLYDYNGDYTRWQDPDKATPGSPRAWHPLIWAHPETDERALWMSPISTVDFEGVSRDEGWSLFEDLKAVINAVEDDTVYHHDWAPGDMVLWSNHTLHHARMPFDSNERRTLRRTPIL